MRDISIKRSFVMTVTDFNLLSLNTNDHQQHPLADLYTYSDSRSWEMFKYQDL